MFTISTRVCRRGIVRSALLQILAIARLLLRFAPSSPSRSASCTPSREIVNTLLRPSRQGPQALVGLALPLRRQLVLGLQVVVAEHVQIGVQRLRGMGIPR